MRDIENLGPDIVARRTFRKTALNSAHTHTTAIWKRVAVLIMRTNMWKSVVGVVCHVQSFKVLAVLIRTFKVVCRSNSARGNAIESG